MRKIVSKERRKSVAPGLDIGEVVETSNDAEAHAHLEKGSLDLILSDINMPVRRSGGDGHRGRFARGRSAISRSKRLPAQTVRTRASEGTRPASFGRRSVKKTQWSKSAGCMHPQTNKPTQNPERRRGETSLTPTCFHGLPLNDPESIALHCYRRMSSSRTFASVAAFRYFTITGVYKDRFQSFPRPLLIGREPGTTTALSGMINGASPSAE